MTPLFDQWYMSAVHSVNVDVLPIKWTLEVAHKYSYSSHSTRTSELTASSLSSTYIN